MKRLVVVLLLAFLLGSLALSFAVPVSAVNNPDSISVESVRVFQNLWEANDQLYVIEYKDMYDTTPVEKASDTFLAAIYDGVTLKRSRPLVYYDHNIISIYCTATEALVWGESYQVKIMGNPSYFVLSEDVNCDTFTLSPVHWIEGSGSTEVGYLETWITDLADTLEISWGGGIDLLTTNDKLTEEGAVTFETAIPGLVQICPDIYEVRVSVYTNPDGTFTKTLSTELAGNVGDRLQNALDKLGDWIGVPAEVAGGVAFGILFFILAGRIFVATHNPAAAIVLAMPFIIIGNLIGLIPLAATFIAVFLVIILFGIVFILARFP